MKGKVKKEKCYICGEEYEVTSEYSTCPDCFNCCCDPDYHKGEPCDGSC